MLGVPSAPFTRSPAVPTTAVLLALTFAVVQDPPGGGDPPEAPDRVDAPPDKWDGSDVNPFSPGGAACSQCGQPNVTCEDIPLEALTFTSFQSEQEHFPLAVANCSPYTCCTLEDVDSQGNTNSYSRSLAGKYKRRVPPDTDEGWGFFFDEPSQDWRDELFPADTSPCR